MKFKNAFALIFILTALFSTIESKKTKNIVPITFYTTKELDSSHLVRSVLVFSGVPFSEARFKKDSTSQRELFAEILNSGFLIPSIPMISDTGKGVKYISTSEAAISYIILSYNKELFSSNLLFHSISIQLSSIVNNYINKVVKILNVSKTLTCHKLLDIKNIRSALKALNDSFKSSKFTYFTGEKISYIDLVIYNLILFIENVSPGCTISNYEGLRDLAFKISFIPQMYKFENSSYFQSLLVPGTQVFAKRINFILSSSKFLSLSS